MSERKYCPRGGIEGIFVEKRDLIYFSSLMEKDYIDEVIPIPGLTVLEQKAALEGCKMHFKTDSKISYWETNEGNHGWCCYYCGKVLQWG